MPTATSAPLGRAGFAKFHVRPARFKHSNMLRVGAALNRINPETGAPEFGVIDWISGLFGNNDKSSSTRPEDTEPKIVFSPPFDGPAVAGEEEQAIRAYFREFPSGRHPILRGINSIMEPIDKWLNEDERPKPPISRGDTVRG